MSGLEAIEESKKYTKDTKFVIISGYADFEYAQSGIDLGISAYLLKPVEEEKLNAVVNSLKEKIVEHKTESNSAFQLNVLDHFNYFSTIGIQENYEEKELSKGFHYFAFGLFVNRKKNPGENDEVMHNVIGEVQTLGDEIVKGGGNYAMVYSIEGTPYFVFLISDSQREYLFSRIKKISVLTLGGVGSVLFCFRGKGVRELYEYSEKLDAEFYIGMNYPSGMILDYVNLSLPKTEQKALRLIYELLEAWSNAESVKYKEILNRLYREYKDEDLRLRFENISCYCTKVTGEPIDGSSFKTFCKSFVDISETMYQNISTEDNDITEQVKEYIQKYYMNDISISQIAGHYNLTANYLSTIFRQKTGCRFIDYLTEIRIMNSKKLLIRNSTVSVKDIAMMVGYNSARHFSTLFQKQVGMTPTTYRKERV